MSLAPQSSSPRAKDPLTAVTASRGSSNRRGGAALTHKSTTLSLAGLLVGQALAAQPGAARGRAVGAPPPPLRPTSATADWTFFGDNCGVSCAAQNANRSASYSSTLPNEYSFGYLFSQATT